MATNPFIGPPKASAAQPPTAPAKPAAPSATKPAEASASPLKPSSGSSDLGAPKRGVAITELEKLLATAAESLPPGCHAHSVLRSKELKDLLGQLK